jgi:Flp pilus assembly protein TadD
VDQALGHDNTDPRLLADRAYLLARLGRLEEALQARKAQAVHEPFSADVHLDCAVLLQRLGRLGEARSAVREALKYARPGWESRAFAESLLKDLDSR